MSQLAIRDWPSSIRVAATLASVAVVCALLYWGQLVLVPLALAGLLTFLLTPLVRRLERWKLGRVPAVTLVVLMTAVLLGMVGWVVGTQVTSLAAELPNYKDNIIQKGLDVRNLLRGGALQRLQATLDEVRKEIEQKEKSTQEQSAPPDPAPPAEAEVEPVPVRVTAEEYLFPNTVDLAPFLRPLGTAGLVIVLLFFMLIYHEDVLSRLVSLAGPRSLAVTTRALDEASRRISRYLLMQFLINSSFGLAVGIGLFFIGVPYAALWGLSAFVLRYIPYVGPWVAALLPIVVSLVHFPGWSTVLLVIALFIALELFSNNVMEPLLYGHSVGLSPVAVIIAAIFWTWMWGPVGLVLATPLTVCLVVLGEHIPGLSLFDRLLSDRPALQPHLWLYQRLLAGDEEDAEEIVDDYRLENSPEDTSDKLLLPTLLFARREHRSQRISDGDYEQILTALGEIIDGLPHWQAAAADAETESSRSGWDERVNVIAFPTQEADVLVFKLLERFLDPGKCALEILSPDMLIAERMAATEDRNPAIVCLSSLPPGGLMQTRAICKSLRARCPGLKIFAGRWTGRGLSDRGQRLLKSAGADATAETLGQLRDLMVPVIQFHLLSQPPSKSGRLAAVSL